MSGYFNVTTNNGDATIAEAIANNTKLNITHVAFGDGNGAVPTPSKTRTTLVKEVHRQAIAKYTIHPTVANWLIVEAIIPSDIGGFWIREIGLIADGILISHGSHAPFFKVAETNGVSEFRLKYTIDIQDGAVVNLTLDESLIYATQAWVNENYVPRNELVDNLTTSDSTKPLTAKQGKKLQDEKAALAGAAFTGGISAPILVAGNEDTSYPSLQFKPKGATNGAIIEMAPSGMPYLAIRPKETLNSSTGQIAIYYFPNKTGNQTLATLTDNVASASKWQTARNVSFSGAATGSFTLDGSANASCVLTLANSGVVAGTYASTIQIPSITVNDKGQITGISQQTIRSASVSQSGVVQLNNTLTSSATDQALTAAQGKALQDNKLDKNANAVSATKLATPRNINGISFDGSSDIVISNHPNELTFGGGNTEVYTLLKLGNYNKVEGAGYAQYIHTGKWNSTSRQIGLSLADDIGTVISTLFLAEDGAYFHNGTNAFKLARITDNVASASKLATVRTIGGVSFDGSGNINLPGVNTQGNQNTTGNAATATKLATARSIGGVSFDGSGNINLPGVNTQGNQNTTGNAATATTASACSGNSATATKLATARTIGGVNFDGTGNINLPGVNTAGNQNTTGNADTATKLSTATGNAPSYSARAWLFATLTSGTPVITGGGNVSSLTDLGVGYFKMNFATAMPDTNFAALATSNGSATENAFAFERDTRTIGSATFQNKKDDSTASDGYFSIAIFR